VSDPVTTESAAPAASTAPTPPAGQNTFGLIALVLAALGFVSAVIPPTAGFAWLLFIPAIVLAIIGLTRRGRPKKLALTGLLVAVVGWLVAIIVTVVTVVTGLGTAGVLDPIPEATFGTDGNGTGAAGLGDTVTNSAGVAFTLDRVECGLTTTGDDFFSEAPTGEWCRLDYTVANGGTEALSMLSGDVKAYVGGTAFEADDATGRFGEDYFTTDLNPGLSAPCVVFIDVPQGTQLDSVAFAPVLSFEEPVLVATT
jgi:hypothetical protein